MDSKNYIEKLVELQSAIINRAKNASSQVDKDNAKELETIFIKNLERLGKQASNLCVTNFFTLRDKIQDYSKVLNEEDRKFCLENLAECNSLGALVNIPKYSPNEEFTKKIVSEIRSFFRNVDVIKDTTEFTLESFNELFKTCELEPINIPRSNYGEFFSDFAKNLIVDVGDGLKNYKLFERVYSRDSKLKEDISDIIDSISVKKQSFDSLAKKHTDFIHEFKELSKKGTEEEIDSFLKKNIQSLEVIMAFGEKGILYDGVRKGVEINEQTTPVKKDDGLEL